MHSFELSFRRIFLALSIIAFVVIGSAYGFYRYKHRGYRNCFEDGPATLTLEKIFQSMLR